MTGAGRLIRQIQFPKLVLPVASSFAGRLELRVRADPDDGADPAALPASAQLDAAVDPADRHRPVLLQPGAGRSAWRPSTSSTATSATSPATRCGCGSTCRPVSMRSRRSRRPPPSCPSRSSSTSSWGTRSPSCSPPTATSSTDRRRRRRRDHAGLGGPGALLVASLVLLALTTLLFKRVEPSFAKVL